MILLSAVVSGATYLSDGKKYEKHIKYLGALVLLSALILPLSTLLHASFSSLFSLDFPEASPDEALYGETLKKEAEKQLSENFMLLIKNRCGLAEHEFQVSALFSLKDKELELSEIKVTLKDLKAVYHREEMRKILSEYCQTLYFEEALTS